MDLEAFFRGEMAAHQNAAKATAGALAGPFCELAGLCAGAVRDGNKIIFFGNGGSAADAQHLATELCVRYRADRAPIAAMALTTGGPMLSAIGNDFGFEDIFARQITAVGKPGDVAIGISTSGASANVIRGLEAAKKAALKAAGLTGRDGGRMKGLADPLLMVPSDDTARIQEMHITLGHMLCAALEKELGLL